MGWLSRLFRRRRYPPPVPTPPQPVFDEAGARRTCEAIWREELGREIDPEGLIGCLNQARSGGTAETIRADVRQSEEYRAKQARAQKPPEQPRPEPVTSPLRVEGRVFVDESGAIFRPAFASALSILAQPADVRARVLDEIAKLGLNGIRVFAGRLTWANQSPALAVTVLPALLNEAHDRGLRVLVTALTDTRDGGYDEADHLDRIADITAPFDHAILECANETYHDTQSDLVQDTTRLLSMAREVLAGYPHPWALGAAATDEPINGVYPNDGGTFNTSHLDRGRDKWNQVRRVRELYAITEVTHTPTLNSEPIGADEEAQPGRRENDPNFFFALGALNRGFDIGGVFHSEDGLHARPLGPVQRACAEAFVAGSRIVPWDARLDYRNARWGNSPVVDAAFTDIGGPIVRAYSFVDGGRGVTVILSTEPSSPLAHVVFGNGWFVADEIAQRPHVTVLRVQQT